jgi:HD-GYP domain-containing protein (c-di-GMP phosphodiesterase class II)
LPGEKIPLTARIVAVADAYDAMGSDRPYRKGMSHDRIDTIFRSGAGQQWDPAVVDAFFRARDDIRSITDDIDRTEEGLPAHLPTPAPPSP